MANEQREEIAFVAISGIRFPTDSREYLMNLVRDVVKAEGAKFVVVGGHTVDGKALASELDKQVLFEKARLRVAERVARQDHKARQAAAKRDAVKSGKHFEAEPFDRTPYIFNYDKFVEGYLEPYALALDEYFPQIEGVNYHIGIAQKVYDKWVGVRLLEMLQRSRNDIRLLGDKRDGNYDTEVKIPVRIKGFDLVRLIMPRKTPWFYEIITGLMQRLINSFAARTFSSKPSLILTGCTGTEAYLPFYKGVPSIALPTLHKIDEQLSTENMVGCVVVRVIIENGRARIIRRTYDFRPIVSRERELLIPQDATKAEKLVLTALKSSPASMNTLVFRVNTAAKSKNGRRPHLDAKALTETLEKLREKRLVVHRKKSNQWAIDERHVGEAQISLVDLLKDTKVVKHAVRGCVHIGALKTLYHTILDYFPGRIYEADAIFDVGDLIQGIAHNYEYNGELLPMVNGFDKQEILAAHIVARNLTDIFKLRLKKLPSLNIASEDLLERCLVDYVFTTGNHPAWNYWQKHAYVLHEFEEELKRALIDDILLIAQKANIRLDYALVKEVVSRKIFRVGESNMVNLDGIRVGVKHPSKSRTKSKSHRIQDVVEFLTETAANNDFALLYIANFHESAGVSVAKFSKTILGVMTGAYLRATSFETDRDKIVNYGFVKVTACINKEGHLVYSDLEFDNYVHPDDAAFVDSDKIMTSQVNRLEGDLLKIYDLPWRL